MVSVCVGRCVSVCVKTTLANRKKMAKDIDFQGADDL